MIKRIFLDLDDVLNTLVPSIFSYYGVVTEEGTSVGYDEYPCGYGWDVIGAVNYMETEVMHGYEIDRDSFWSNLDRRFWATIPKSPICDWLVRTAGGLVGENNVFVLTKATLDGSCLAGKFDWVKRNLPDWMLDKMITCAHKHVCAHESLLIDDNQDNIRSFLHAGGGAIMFPRPWNDLHDISTDEDQMGFIRTQLKAIFPTNSYWTASYCPCGRPAFSRPFNQSRKGIA